LFAVVHCYLSRNTEAADNILPEEFLQDFGCDVAKRFCLHPFGEVIHYYGCVFVIAWCRWQGPNNMNALSEKRPHRRYEVHLFGWELAVVCVLLAVRACCDHFLSFCHCRRPIEAFSECFAHEGSCAGVR
jgi:hypothetical protein